ncbi:N-succinylglutamate 5-semialdehyde dehydrogenase [Rubripirellula tenax]|uniref:L-glutamate gamma-semialdehyde dehydrogenase n=1 Tax=Rubripirellula tenax TaxID=2528015 RepID=A0A5C6EZV8_9BACT|nr:aldehyde dehydrogenase family protein [Rubripirellula tenax]TWU54658.1 N-succinylglutamate 5-semialdehyde dehydrogenase [Rubripirellula tenax]
MNLQSVSFISGEPIFDKKATNKQEIGEILEKAKVAGQIWANVSVADRIECVRQFGAFVSAHRDQISKLISSEVGKLPWDADGEVSASIAKVELSIAAMETRRRDRILQPSNGPVQRQVRYRPIGVGLVLGPFNFPLHLPGGQIIPLLLAGNAVVFKPSEKATAVGQWMMDAWHQSGLPRDVMQWIVGAGDTAVTAIDRPEVGGVFLTGSRAVGQAIHRQLAGRPEVMLALELGGNNPIIVTESVPPDTVAKLVSFSAFVSAGQRCTCARRAIFVDGNDSNHQINALVIATEKLSAGLPGDNRAEVGPLIDATAAKRLKQTYDELLHLGCKPLLPFAVDPRHPALVRPSILDATDISPDGLAAIGAMEWFGPLLVVQRVKNFEAAIHAAARTPYGLAASLLGGSKAMFDQFAAGVGAGVVNWNGPTTGAAGALPFGGLDASGNHRPAGYYAIDFCSDPVSSLLRDEPSTDDPWSIVS